MESYILTRQEAAKILDISVRSIDRYIKSGKIRSEKKGTKVYVNDDDINNLKGANSNNPVIITESGGEKNNEQFYKNKIVKNGNNEVDYDKNYDKITKTFENIYSDLRSQIENKDEIIQKLSIEMGRSQEQVKQSISVSEHNRSQMILEESKTHIAKQMTSLTKEKEILQKELKDEKFDKKILILFVFIFLALAAYFWFKTI